MKTAPRTASTIGPCYGVEDGLDGYCIHNVLCRHVGKSWTGPNSDCVKAVIYEDTY